MKQVGSERNEIRIKKAARINNYMVSKPAANEAGNEANNEARQQRKKQVVKQISSETSEQEEPTSI